MPTKFIDITTDFGFKRVFGRDESKEIMKGFLFDMLELPYPIEELFYLPQEQTPDYHGERLSIYDIHCTDTSGRKFIVEMQKHWQWNFKERTLYYISLAISRQAKKGKWNFHLLPVYCVSIADFYLSTKEERKTIQNGDYLHPVELVNTKTKTIFYQKLKIAFVELPNFHKKPHELTDRLDKWIYIIKNMVKLTEVPAEFSEETLLQLFKMAEYAKLTPKERIKYEGDLKRDWDHQSILESAEEKGLLKGRQEGRQEGRKEGRQEGIQQTQIETARRLLQMGLDIKSIAQATELSIEQINQLTTTKE